ncbi:putative oxidoreductase GLYR1 [Morella rubra]|uniref:Putative oxidoreductase GLYR1 n=1 Tax=Morella rubra TaxID=262757 RepID=A0A6A1UPT9_9ROSI|nr:putative oxidoreductase GLYR1 [Morella rubra]
MKSRTSEVEDGSNTRMDLFEYGNGLIEDRTDRFAAHVDSFDRQVSRFDAQDDRFDAQSDKEEHVELGTVSEYNSLLSEFDDFVASENNGVSVGLGMSRALSFGFEVGDMVWGKVKSHPWWPGHIFNDAFATPSVRRTRREGYVLVAFFGDSSYGWFDPAELIPFDLYFAEKSRQTNSRTFVKAVEEAVDEASRRRGLGLVCKCRNSYNFRITTAQGYFAVDVPDYEPGGVYSINQIKKERDNFRPRDILAFVKQLALVPRGCDHQGMDFLKNKATMFAYRKAVFEEFDETYAQAFGVQPGRPSRDPVDLDQLVRMPSRAPLSGPLVIAEALGGAKGSAKPLKIKDHSKKDRYLFKRRDEPTNSKTNQVSLGQANSSAPSVYVDGAVTTAAADYVLQKRALPAPAKHEEVAHTSKDSATPSLDVFGKEVVSATAAFGSTHGHQDDPLDLKSPLDKGKGSAQETKDRLGPGQLVGATSAGWSDLPREMASPLASQSFQQEADAKMLRPYEDFRQPEQSFLTRVEGAHGLDQVRDSHGVADPSSFEAKRPGGMTGDGGVKKAKVLGRTTAELSSENSVIGEKKKKKKRKESSTEIRPDHPQKKRFVTGKVGASAGKFNQIGLASREDFHVEHQKKNVGSINSSIDSVGEFPPFGLENSEIELPQLLSDLQALALDPFHGIERDSPAVARLFFLRFRSLVYQKSLVLSPSTETESVEVRPTKSLGGRGAFDGTPGGRVRDMPSSKPVKSILRPEDPTKSGRKRGPSDRQEEIAAKKLKKINAIKSLAAEKKASQKTSESQRGEGRESIVPAPPKSSRADLAKRVEPPAKVVEPTMLVMKFPPCTSLPSLAELKARFARFGPIDQSGLRVFWKSSTCRVVFLHKRDAEAACRYAVSNNSLFGNVNVRCHIREMGVATPDGSDSGKGRGDDNTSYETPRVKDPALVQRPVSGLANQTALKPAVQLKSCLKKSSGDEAAGQVTGGGSSKGTPRVKFMLGGEESSRGEQLMVGNRNNFNDNASIADGGAPSSVAMDFNSKNFQKVIPPSPLPILPLPSQFAKGLHSNLHHSEMAPSNAHNPINTPTTAPTVDISQQFISLLTRCNDVVTNVTGLLGYVPYHPL